MRRPAALLVGLLIGGLLASPALAEWPAAGDTLWGDPHIVYSVRVTGDESDGVLALFGTWGSSSGSIARARRITRDGVHYVNWDWNNSPGGSTSWPDGAGGVFKTFPVFPNFTTGIHHVRPEGGLEPAWPPFGVDLGYPHGLDKPEGVAHDASSGAFVTIRTASRVVVQHVLPNGTLDPTWRPGGAVLDSVGTSTPTFARGGPADGAGGVYVAWASSSDSSRLFLQRVAPDGMGAPGWPAAGLVLATATSTPTLIAMLASGPEHLIVVWSTSAGVRAARLHRSGSLDPAWAGGGPAGLPSNVGSAIEDGSGGMFLLAGTRAVHVHVDGSIAPGWAGAGVAVVDPAAVVSGSVCIAKGVAGGLAAAWDDGRRPSKSLIRARWLDAAGLLAPGSTDSGVVVHPLTVTKATLHDAWGDGTGDMYVGWVDDSWPFPYMRAMLTKMAYPGIVDVPPSQERTPLGLSAPWPNPARDALNVRFTLPDDAPARVELLDLAGRRMRTIEVAGAGPHLERFDRVQGLPSGVYLVRLSQGSSARTARVALIR